MELFVPSFPTRDEIVITRSTRKHHFRATYHGASSVENNLKTSSPVQNSIARLLPLPERKYLVSRRFQHRQRILASPLSGRQSPVVRPTRGAKDSFTPVGHTRSLHKPANHRHPAAARFPIHPTALRCATEILTRSRFPKLLELGKGAPMPKNNVMTLSPIRISFRPPGLFGP